MKIDEIKLLGNFKSINIAHYLDGNHYIISIWSGFIIKLLTGILSCAFTGVGIYLLYKVFNSFNTIDNPYIPILFSFYFLPMGVFLFYAFFFLITKRETWFVDGNLHNRKSLFGYSRGKIIPKEKIRNVVIGFVSAIGKTNYWRVMVSHYLGSRIWTMKKEGYWTLTVAGAIKDKEADFLFELLSKEIPQSGKTSQTPVNIKPMAEANLRRRKKVLSAAYIISGVWGFIGLIFCLVVEYIPINFIKEWKTGSGLTMFLLTFYPFGFTAVRMGTLEINASKNGSKEELSINKMWSIETLKTFPISTGFLLLVWIHAFFVINLSFIGIKIEEPFLVFASIFYATIAFINLRIFLFGRKLTSRWETIKSVH